MNIPSIYKIEYILPEDIDSFIYNPGDIIDITNYVNGSFTELSISGQASLNASLNKNDAGLLYEIESSLTIAGKNASVFQVLDQLANRDRVYRFTDVNYKQYLVGTKQNPAKLNFNETNDKQPTGFRGYDCSISCTSVNGIIYLA